MTGKSTIERLKERIAEIEAVQAQRNAVTAAVRDGASWQTLVEKFDMSEQDARDIIDPQSIGFNSHMVSTSRRTLVALQGQLSRAERDELRRKKKYGR